MTARILLTRTEAAEQCGVSPAYISAAIANGELRAKRTGPNNQGPLRIRPTDLEAWIDSWSDA